MKKEVIDIINKSRIESTTKVDVFAQEILDLFSVNERYVLVEWLNEFPLVDGALYFDSKEELLEYHKKQPKVDGVTHSICRIRNAR